MTEKIPNFYFDLIARIVPGGLFLALIFRSKVAILKDPSFSSLSQAVIVTFVGLVSAYIVGYLLETCASSIDWVYERFVIPWLKKEPIRSRLKVFVYENFLPSRELWTYYAARRKKLAKEEATEHFFDLKEMAERILFRTLLLIPLFAWALEFVLKIAGPATNPVRFLVLIVIANFLVLLTFLKIWYFASQRVKRAAGEPCPCGGRKDDRDIRKYKDCCGK